MGWPDRGAGVNTTVEHLLSPDSAALYSELFLKGWIKARDILGDDGPSSSSPHRRLRKRIGELRAELMAISSDQMVVSDKRGYKLTDDPDEIRKWLRTQDAQARARYVVSHKVRTNLKYRNPRQRELPL